MRQQAVWATTALVIVASLSNWANAFHHGSRGGQACGGNVNYGCGGAYPYCTAGYPACGGCGPSVGYPSYSCAYYARGVSAGHSCCLGTKIHKHCLAKQARHQARRAARNASSCNAPYGYAPCCYAPGSYSPYCGSGGCGSDGCNSGGCNSGGCNSGGCNSGGCAYGDSYGALDLPAGARIISDKVVGESETPSPTPDERSAVADSSPYRLTGFAQNDAGAKPAFERGLASFRKGSMNDALRAFTTAAEAEPSSAIYHYYRALAMFEAAGADAAQDLLATAVEVERREGLENWGQRMERVQGRGRLWIENARRDANLVR
jgi:hypothetical protein